jgi:3-isopropylmalate/(R)-2-methylmalate dehydratase small subunit
MQKFTRLTGVAAPLLRAGIDTGTIIQSVWLRSRSFDLGQKLFSDWRYDSEGKENPDFVLNQPRFRTAKVLVAGPDFGCGSSREGAVWALQKFGIDCVIAPSFGEIFRENAYQNALLPVELPREQVEEIGAWAARSNDSTLTVDLAAGTIQRSDGVEYRFDLPEVRRTSLLEGLDETDMILRSQAAIDAFQAADRAARPWIHLRETTTN